MNEKYAMREGEELYEYGLRLIAIKIEEKPDDLDWEDIVEATGIECHRDSLRKAAAVTPYSGYQVMQYMKAKYAKEGSRNPNEYMEELDIKLAAIRKESKRFYDQRREFNKLVDKLGRAENLEDRLVEAAESLNQERPLEFVQHFAVDGGYNEAVIVFADWHYGMVTNNIWEEFNTEICKERVKYLVSAAKARIELHKCRRLHVLLLGDLAHGGIHTSARVASEELVCEQVMHVGEIVAQAINELSSCVEETAVYATYGNHLRSIQNKKDSIHADNIERLIPWWLQQRFKDREDIIFPEADYYEFLYLDVCGYKICATHGDLDGVKGAGKTLNTLFAKKYNCGIDYVILADKHHLEEFEELGIDSMIVRSLCGTDEYANTKRLYSSPGQLLMIFNPYIGRDATYSIKLGDV